MARAAAFLDRDGVVNRDIGYLHRWEDFEFLPGALDAMRRLHDAGYALVIVTNQSGIARGYYTEADYQALTAHLRSALAAAGCPAAGIYHCPHHPAGTVAPYAIECDCRKPRPGMLLQAARELGLDLPSSFMVGDKLSDLQAAHGAGVKHAYLVRSSQPIEPGVTDLADGVFDSLADLVLYLNLGPRVDARRALS